MQNYIPRVAAIHDLSGFGRTSLMVVIPVISSLGIQVCPLPTAVLSTHTSGFTDFRFVDLTDAMHNFLQHWQELELKFEGIYSGFLGSAKQVDTVATCIDTCLKKEGIVVVDPVLGDNGILDPTMNMDIVARMRWLISKATCITPNLTEAAFLLEEQYPCIDTQQNVDEAVIKEWLIRLTEMGPETAVITSVPLDKNKQTSSVVAYQRNAKQFWRVDCEYVPAYYPGTGDTFASVLTGCLMRKDSLALALDKAVRFVSLGIEAAYKTSAPHRDGIFLEAVLHTLNEPLPQLCCFEWT